jgi:hypothetical protein
VSASESDIGAVSAICTPISSVLSALHRSDLLLFSAPIATRTLPVSPYPAQPGTRVRAHLVSETQPPGDGWEPWVGGWAKWVRGRVLGYRDFAGREAKVRRSLSRSARVRSFSHARALSPGRTTRSRTCSSSHIPRRDRAAGLL